MTQKYESLDKYTRITKKILKFKLDNKDILKKFEDLQNEKAQAESDLREETKKVQFNLENDYVKATYSPSFKKWYDLETAISSASPKVKKFLVEHCVKQEIDRTAFEDAVDKGEVPVEIKQKAYREKPMSPRIIIKEKIHDDQESND